MFDCNFILNDQPMSNFSIEMSGRQVSFPAYSGFGPHVNRRVDACLKGVGPIPTGAYYILNREAGGRLGWLRNLYNDKSDWLSLYAIDNQIDDQTWCDAVERG